MIESIPGITAIILKLCLNETQFEEYKENYFSDTAVYATFEEEESKSPCFYVHIEDW